MNEEKTHYRKAFNSPYLSSADITEPTHLTVRCVRLEPDKTKRTKDSFNTMYFVETEIRKDEKLKPMILNRTNSATMKDLTGSAYIDDWNGVHVTIYVDPNVKMMGEVVDGLRVSKTAPQVKQELTASDVEKWTRAIDRCKKDGNLDAVKAHMIVSPENEKLILEQANALQH